MLIVINLSWAIHWVYDPFPPLLARSLCDLTTDKTDLAPLRLLNFLALARATVHFVRPDSAFLRWRAVQPIILCGQHSLYIFCLGIVLAVLGHFVLNEFDGTLAMQVVVNLVGFALMIGTAALLAMVQDRRSRRLLGPRQRLRSSGEHAHWRLLFGRPSARGIAAHPARAADAPRRPDATFPTNSSPRNARLALAGQLAAKQPITIVAIGGGSTAGTAAGKGEHALSTAPRGGAAPAPSGRAHHRHQQGNAARNDQQMVDRLARDVYPFSPTLVIWETGTFDAAEASTSTNSPTRCRPDLLQLARAQSRNHVNQYAVQS